MSKIDQLSPNDLAPLDRFGLEVGNAVHFYRKQKDLTLDELASVVGVSKSTISKIENGKQGYTGETITKIAEALGIRPTDIFKFAEAHTSAAEANEHIDWEKEAAHAHLEAIEDSTHDRIRTTVVPLISWVQAGTWQTLADPNVDSPGANELIATTYKAKAHTYALRVRGDSMEPKFPEGCIIIVEPEEDVLPGKYVIVRQNGDEATFKQLIKDGSTLLLKPLNDRYPIMELRKDAVFCGVVRKMEMDI